MPYETVIGLEVHVRLLTQSKIFCGCPNQFTHEKNKNVCPVCLGQPGALPVLNREAFIKGMKTGLALDCTIAQNTKFDRKHYYYPDLPKNYQISQYDQPVAEHGHLDVSVDGETARIGITRAHLEEDAGKLIHEGSTSQVDLNRTGTPLIEIVTEPDLRSPAQAREFLNLLKQTLLYIGVSDCNMQEGSLRCDANLSIRPVGETELGVKNEIKNMNSFRAVENAITLVREELIDACEEGREIKQVTWGYNIDNQSVFQMRTKEMANDYRYFPDPDLPPVQVNPEWIQEVRDSLCELPVARRERFVKDYALPTETAGELTQDKAVADYFEEVAQASGQIQDAANWVQNDVLRECNDRNLNVADFPVTAAALTELIQLVGEKTINRPTARKLFARIIEGETESPRSIVESEGLAQVSDTGAIEKLLEEVMADNAKAVADIEGGKYQTAGFFVGKIMQGLKGQGDPSVIGEVIAKRFNFDPSLLAKKKKKK
ncbi:MAG: Asp-tRNA(Asn)/Glu-tRNA(Gln) amidotransferase subunit GatB [Planctomycetota bacterium]|jgi:aspartyl-tRNA(Asn)/glutamyl-tRNA(Gln) amidotransferase subunit B